ncbi:conjugative transposon protein TraJ [Ravibacter arvi]|uniref:Conjugative transposon protein TraJ n=1 Tax=Ravibacter arvi TaxID=2051041 RepID=A0ABP8LLZ8_9BACT
MKVKRLTMIFMAVGILCPFFAQAQGVAGDIKGLQVVLDQLYSDMIGLSSSLIGVSRGLAGFGALFYIAARVWRHIAAAEPVDFYPLFRPFVLGFCILFFPSVLALINGVMKPVVSGTANLAQGSQAAIQKLLEQKQKVIEQSSFWQMYVGATGEGNRDAWYRYTHPGEDPEDEGMFDSVGNDIKFAMAKAYYNFSNSVKQWMAQVLEILFQAAALCINTLRTFQLIVLAILGPLVFGLAVFDGFQRTLFSWLARYLNVFLWLPVANIFGAILGRIQQKMIEIDIAQIQQAGNTFFSSQDAGYLIFLIIGIVGYLTVPSVAGFIIQTGGGGALGQKMTSLFSGTMAWAGARSAAAGRTVVNSAQNLVSSQTHHTTTPPSSHSYRSRNISGTPR